jgi:glycosyltransferase involved in cell wall biosynthesis
MSSEPLVSIGLPTYNRAATLVRAIESALKQDYQNIELLISDNGSIDETEAICLDAASRDNRVKYLRQQTNQGATANFSEVLRQSGGEFFIWLADDDWLDQSYIDRCVRILRERPDYSLVCGKARYFQEGKFLYEGVAIDLPQQRGSDRVLAYYAEVADNGTFYGVMRRAEILRVPIRNAMGGDWLLIAAIAFTGKVKTLSDVHANRSLGGAVRSIQGMGYSAAYHLGARCFRW